MEGGTTKGPDAYSRLRRLIVSGKLIPGQRVSERELAAQLSISRTPVREALRQLVQEGVVAYEPRRGYRIATISEEQARHLFTLREALEVLAVRLACQNQDRSFLDEMQAAILSGQAAYREGSLGDLIATNQRFHILLAYGSGNPYLVSTFEKLQAHIALMMSQSLSWHRRPEETLSEHQAIVDAIKEGDATRAEELIAEHIRRAFDGYLRKLRRST